MNKKGFTLIELLSVVAIIAILVIIALPNVMNLFNDAKQKSFETELQTIYKTAKSQWISDSKFNSEEIIYSSCDEGCDNPLNLSGRKTIDYYIRVNKAGKVVEFYATDGTYQYAYDGELLIEDIGEPQTIANITEEEEIFDISDIANPGIITTTIIQTCRPGYRVLPNGSCEICPANTFSIGITSTACTPCNNGKCSEPGSSSCTATCYTTQPIDPYEGR